MKTLEGILNIIAVLIFVGVLIGGFVALVLAALLSLGWCPEWALLSIGVATFVVWRLHKIL